MSTGSLESSGTPRGPAVAGFSRAVVPARFGESTRSIPLLETLAVPEACLALLRPPLESEGYQAQEAERTRLEGGSRSTVRYTLILKARGKWPLLYLQDEILSDYTPGNRAALVEVRELFEDEFRTLYLLHDAQPRGAYRNLAGEWEARYGVRTRFLPTSGIHDFAQMTLKEQIAYLKRELELGAVPSDDAPAPQKPPAADLGMRHIQQLITVLGNISQFDTASHREVFLSSAGLRDLVSAVQLEGTRTVVAGAVVLELIRLDGRGLAELVQALQALTDLPRDARTFIEGLLDRYAFA